MKYSLRSLMRFSLRDLFWLVVVVALVLGWWVNHRRQVADCEEQRAVYEREIRKMEGWVSSLSTDYGIDLEFGKQGNIKGVTQYGNRRIPPIIRLPKAPAQNSPNNQGGPLNSP